MVNKSTLQMAAALALLVVGAMASVYAILTTAPTGADVGPSEAALRCREDSLALVEGATTSAALAGGGDHVVLARVALAGGVLLEAQVPVPAQ